MDIQSLRKSFSKFDVAFYEELLQHGTVRQVKKGEVLLQVKQPIRNTILIVEGLIKLYQEDTKGNELFIYYLAAGQACSLSLTFAANQAKSSVLARAVTDAVLLTIPPEYMDKWMSQYKDWYHFIINSYYERVEVLLKMINLIAFSNMDERLLFYLQKQVQQLGPKLKLTHREIANDLNSSREVISKLLKKMQAKHYIKLHRNVVEWTKKGDEWEL